MAKGNKFSANNCPECGSPEIEQSYGSFGYMQCNSCGAEWRQGRVQKIDWKNFQRDQQRALKHLKSLDMRRKRL